MTRDSWIVCQIGARENFSVARALHRQGGLHRLVTDLWCPQGWPAGLRDRLGRVGERGHPDLPDARVWAPMGPSLLREVSDRARRRRGWGQMMARNAWFQRRAAAYLRRCTPTAPATVFAYSYAAGDIFAAARARGWTTVLGQIDPGPVEARMVAQLYRDAGQAHVHDPIPETYWQAWRRETDLADRIVVNSDWSRQGLIAEGVPEEKIRILPLAHEGPRVRTPRPPLPAFTPARPLRLLFLGLVSLRKGADLVLEAMRLCPDLPLHLDVVGAVQIALPDWVRTDPRIVVHGPVPRSRVADFYGRADLFLFPTRSDGFGLTQLEAQAAGVPVLASRQCGAVVRPGIDGIVLEELTAPALADALRRVLAAPETLTRMQRAVVTAPCFGLEDLATGLYALSDAPRTGTR